MERQFDQAVTPEVAPVVANALPAPIGPALTTHSVLRLQRSSGNAAVSALLTARRPRGVLARDPLEGGAAGQVESATGGAVSLTSINGSFVLPAGRLLSGTGTAELRTQSDTTITVTITGNELRLSMSPPLYIDAQWPAQNMVLSSVVHQIDTEVTTVDVRTVNDEWGDGMLDFTGTARGTIADTVASIIAHTPLHRSRMRAPTMGSPRAPAAPLPPAYNPLQDENPMATIDALILGFNSLPAGGTSDVSARDVSSITAGATLTINDGFEQLENGTGVRIAAGTSLSVNVASGASIAQLRGAAPGAPGIAAAADIQSIGVSSAGIEVIKDGARVATLDRITIHRGGSVSLDRITLHGEAERLAQGESGLWALLLGLPVAVATGGGAEGLAAGAELAHQRGADRPVIVPGLTRAMIEIQLQRAFTQLLAEHGRTAIPGVDLGAVLGVPSGPAAPARGR